METTKFPETKFTETQSAVHFKATHGGTLQVIKNPERGNLFFMCGDGTFGHVSKPLQEKIKNNEPLGVMMISHVASKDFNGYMLHNQAQDNVMLDL